MQIEKKINYVGYTSLFLLCIMGIGMLCPIVHDSANAEGEPVTYANVTPSLSVSLQDAVELSLMPSASGEFGTGTAIVTVSTTSSEGYAIYMHTANGQDTLTSSTGGVVAAVSGTVSPSGFANNTWGYAFGKTINPLTAAYQALPTSTTSPILTEDTSATKQASDTYTLAFGAKINNALPSGEYKNQVIVS